MGSGICDQPWETRGFLSSSPELYSDNEERDMDHALGSPTSEGEAYLTVSPSLGDQLPCGECLEADSGTIPLPQFSSWGTFSQTWPPEVSHVSESEWEDLEEAEDPDDSTLRWVALWVG